MPKVNQKTKCECNCHYMYDFAGTNCEDCATSHPTPDSKKCECICHSSETVIGKLKSCTACGFPSPFHPIPDKADTSNVYGTGNEEWESAIRKNINAWNHTQGYNKDELIEDIRTLLNKAREEEKRVVLSMVEDILPFGAGFTGRFYTLKDELLTTQPK